MSWFSVYVECRSDTGGTVPEDAVDAMADLVAPHHGATGGGGVPPRWDARISVEAEDAAGAVIRGAGLVLALAANAGLPAWPPVVIEASREDVLEEQLAIGNAG